jgi:DNA-directed RNA polymerase subunit RPC12/RpoP
LNYIPARRAFCLECGADFSDEPVDETGCRCDECHLKDTLAARVEALSEFRWQSRNWLRCDDCAGTGMRLEGYCYCRKGNAAHEAEAARFAFVKSLPALAVTSARHMREAGIDPEERIAR